MKAIVIAVLVAAAAYGLFRLVKSKLAAKVEAEVEAQVASFQSTVAAVKAKV